MHACCTHAHTQEHALFVEGFRRWPPGTAWIVKPSARSQGKGIFLVNKISQARRCARCSWRRHAWHIGKAVRALLLLLLQRHPTLASQPRQHASLKLLHGCVPC